MVAPLSPPPPLAPPACSFEDMDRAWVSQKADVYSFGVLLVSLFVGELQWPGVVLPTDHVERGLMLRQLALAGVAPCVPPGTEVCATRICVVCECLCSMGWGGGGAWRTFRLPSPFFPAACTAPDFASLPAVFSRVAARLAGTPCTSLHDNQRRGPAHVQWYHRPPGSSRWCVTLNLSGVHPATLGRGRGGRRGGGGGGLQLRTWA